jgi:anti-sigma factor RsiW
MNCHQVQEELSGYLEGLIDPAKHHAIEHHLASCSECLPEAKHLSDTIRGVASLPETPLPAGFSQRVMTQIRAEAEGPTLWARLFFPFKVKIPLHAMGLLVIGLAVYFYQASEPIKNRMTSSLPSEAPPAFKQAPPKGAETTESQLKKGAPAGADRFAPSPERKSLADPNQALPAEGDRLESSKREAPAGSPAPQGLMKSKESRSEMSPSAGAVSQDRAILSEPVSPDVVLALSSTGAAEETAMLTSRIKQAAERSDGKVIALIKDEGGEETQLNFWLNLPKSEYRRFKSELSKIGTILSESPLPPDTLRPDGKPPTSIRVLVTYSVGNSKDTGPVSPLE